jgi:hypothetical protein
MSPSAGVSYYIVGGVFTHPRPQADLGAYSICNEYAAVIKQITHQRNTSLRTPKYLQVSSNIALMLPIHVKIQLV